MSSAGRGSNHAITVGVVADPGVPTEIAHRIADGLPDEFCARVDRDRSFRRRSRLLDYERVHNNRVQVMEALENRLQELREGATPSGGTQEAQPVEAEDTPGDSEPSGSPEPMHPPRHGIGRLPGKPKADRPRKQ